MLQGFEVNYFYLNKFIIINSKFKLAVIEVGLKISILNFSSFEVYFLPVNYY